MTPRRSISTTSRKLLILRAAGIVLLVLLAGAVLLTILREGGLEITVTPDGFEADETIPPRGELPNFETDLDEKVSEDPPRHPTDQANNTRTAADTPAWAIEIEDDGTLRILFQHASVVTARHVFWGQDWEWTGTLFNAEATDDLTYRIDGEVPDLGLEFNGTIRADRPAMVSYTYTMDAAHDLENIIGGGLEFQLRLDPSPIAEVANEPVLLAENRGWRWDTGAGVIEISFSDSMPDVYFERNQPDIIRTMFVGSKLEHGLHAFGFRMMLPDGIDVKKPASQRYDDSEPSSWPAGLLPFDGSPVDLRHLNHTPAGSKGFVQVDGDGLVFEDGTPARFWGTNLAAYALFEKDDEAIETQARRIAQLGYNLVRIHHHDSMRWVSPTVIDQDRDDSRHLDMEAMERLDYLIKSLRDEGIYIWLDLHVGRQLKPGDVETEFGTIEGFDEIERNNGSLVGFCYYNDPIRKLMKEFNEQYLNHVNVYTELAYKDDPAIMGLLITNENDLTTKFGNLMLPDKNNPIHNAFFEATVDAFCEETGLPRDQAWRTWEPGPSKLYLNHQENRFNEAMLAHLREELGARGPIATTNYWGHNGLFSLPALTAGDVIDGHTYGESEAFTLSPRHDAHYGAWLACAQVYGMPFTVTEWNVEYPQTDRFTAPLFMASLASLQEWDALMLYNYSQQGLSEPHRIDTWSTWIDPALTAIMPAAAIAFREGHIRAAETTYCLMLDREQLFFSDITPRTSAALRTLTEMSRVTIGLPETPVLEWLVATEAGADTIVITDPHRDFIPEGQDVVESDTGELRRDWQRGIHTINTAKTQAVSGWVGGEVIALDDVRFYVETPKAVVAVTSLDGQPIRESDQVLLTAVARADAPDNTPPLHSEPVRGELRFTTSDSMRLTPLHGDGSQGPTRSISPVGDEVAVAFDASEGIHWYLLSRGTP